MAYYSEDAIEEILSVADIVSIISEYVSLTKRGRNFIGLCPFHREKTPSFSVSTDKQIFKCFGCSEGGNVIHFIMKIENLDFVEAIEYLGDKLGVDLDKFTLNSTKSSKINKDEKNTLFEICTNAAKFYHENLMLRLKDEESVEYEYVKKRNLDMNILIKFGIGLSDSKRPLYNYLLELGYSKKDIINSGIIVENDRGIVYDRFFGRLIFPILDIRNRVIAFGGRVLNDSLPKYLNSPENLIYHKGKNLYLMNFAKKEKLDKVIITEGYMDAISMQKYGYTNTIASLGTALTDNQAKLLKNYTDNIIIAYDQDAAGTAATMRGLDILSSKGLNVKVLKLDKEDAKDPDEYLNKYGKHRFDKCLDKSVSLIEYKVSIFEKELNLEDVTSKIKFLNKIANILSKITNNIEKEIYVDLFSSKYKLSKEAILKEVNKNSKIKNEEFKNFNITGIINKDNKNKSKDKKIEQHIISLMLSKDKYIFNKIKESFNLNDFIYFKDIYSKILNLSEECDINKVDVLSRFKEEKDIKDLTEILYIDSYEDKNKLLDELIKYNNKSKYDRRKIEILSRLKENISDDEKSMLKHELNGILVMSAKFKK